MNRYKVTIGCVAAFLASLLPSTSWAEDWLSCQSNLAATDCFEVKGAWPAQDSLVVLAGCQECGGKGSEVSCGTAEKVTASALTLEEDPTFTVVPGTFSEIKKCIGVPLYSFDGTLAGGKTYHLIGDIAPHGRTILLTFSTSGSGNGGSDAGTSPVGDGGETSTGDGGSNTGNADGGPGGSGGPGSLDDGGCDCNVNGPVDANWLLVLLLGHSTTAAAAAGNTFNAPRAGS